MFAPGPCYRIAMGANCFVVPTMHGRLLEFAGPVHGIHESPNRRH